METKFSNEPIEPKSNYTLLKGLYNILPKRLLICAATFYVMMLTPLTTAMTMNYLQGGKTKEEIEKEFSGERITKDSNLILRLSKKPIEILSTPGIKLGYYLHEKGIWLKP